MATRQEDRLTCTVPEAAKKLGIGLSLAYLSASRGDIPTIRIGGRILVPLKALEKLLAGEEESEVNQVNAQSGPPV